MNADDVVFSFKRMFDRSNPFFKSANGNFPEFAELIEPSLESVERTDDETVVFTLKAPLAPLVLDALDAGVLDHLGGVCGNP